MTMGDYWLTRRQQQVLALLADGHNLKTAAAKLGVSYSYVRAIMVDARRRNHVRATVQLLHDEDGANVTHD